MFELGVNSLIWVENFTENDVYLFPKLEKMGFSAIDICLTDMDAFPIQPVKWHARRHGIRVITTITLGKDANLISPDASVRANGVKILKQAVDVSRSLGSTILGGVNYAAWGYLTGKPRTQQEWEWSVTSMREVAKYARDNSDICIAVECVNRFETHFLNIAQDAVQYCRDVGTGNVKVHLDSFHMIREETSFAGAVKTCGKDYLGYVHACENNRGIPGTGLVPWEEFIGALRQMEYKGPLVIESFNNNFKEINRLCAIWRQFAASGEELAVEGRKNLMAVMEKFR